MSALIVCFLSRKCPFNSLIEIWFLWPNSYKHKSVVVLVHCSKYISKLAYLFNQWCQMTVEVLLVAPLSAEYFISGNDITVIMTALQSILLLKSIAMWMCVVYNHFHVKVCGI